MAIIPADEKVFMVDKRTNTTYGGSQALQDMQQWYTMQDVADSVQSYKVFTALLTQSGGDNTQSKKSGALTIGVTYSITEFGPLYGADFTNVGAPNNNEGTYFVATGTTPNSWGDNLGGEPILLYNTGAPVATVLENTIGNVWFTYQEIGLYNCFYPNLDYSKLAVFGQTYPNVYLYKNGGAPVQIGTGGEGDGYINNYNIEIRVYND